jgi:hypothetical protein
MLCIALFLGLKTSIFFTRASKSLQRNNQPLGESFKFH